MFLIRKEKKREYLADEKIIRDAYAKVDPELIYEAYRFCALRGSKAFVPELTFVAEQDGEPVGVVTLAKGKVVDGLEEHEMLFLAYWAVLPSFQGKGIGKTLLKNVLQEAKFLGYPYVLVEGDLRRFKNFGFQATGEFALENSEGKKTSELLIALSKEGTAVPHGTFKKPETISEKPEENDLLLYDQALEHIQAKRHRNVKYVKRGALIASLLFTIAAVVMFVLQYYHVTPNHVGIGSIVLAIGLCLTSIGLSNFVDDKKIMGAIAMFLSAIVIAIGVYIMATQGTI